MSVKKKRRSELIRETKKKLEKIAKSLGFKQVNEYQILKEKRGREKGAVIDAVWIKNLPKPFGEVAVIGFEIEASWRTSKHLKGDVFNLLALSPAVGVIIFLKKGFDFVSDFEMHIRNTKRYVERFSGLSRISVWSEDDLEKIMEKLGIQ